MKQMLRKLLAAVMCLCMLGMAAAQETVLSGEVILPEDPDGSRRIKQVAVTRDTVYVMTTTGARAELWRWRQGMSRAEVYPEPMLYAPYYGSTEDAQQGLKNLLSDVRPGPDAGGDSFQPNRNVCICDPLER